MGTLDASASASTTGATSSEGGGLEDVDWAEKLKDLDYEAVLDTFKGGVSDKEAGQLGEDIIVQGGSAVLATFGFPPQATSKLLKPFGKYIGKPLGRGIKKAVDGIRDLFTKGKPKAIRIDEQPGTWFGSVAVQRRNIDAMMIPVLVELQLLHRELGLRGRYRIRDIMRSLRDNFGLDTASSDYQNSTVHPSLLPTDVAEAYRLDLAGNSRYEPFERPAPIWAPNIYRQYPGQESGKAGFEAFQANREAFTRAVREWQKRFLEAVAKEQSRLVLLRSVQEARAQKAREAKMKYDQLPGSFREFWNDKSSYSQDAIRDILEQYQYSGGTQQGLVDAFRKVSGPGSERPAWFTEYWGKKIQAGERLDTRVVKDVKQWLRDNPDYSGFAALGMALDYAYDKWLMRVWGKEHQLATGESRAARYRARQAMYKKAYDGISGSFKQWAAKAITAKDRTDAQKTFMRLRSANSEAGPYGSQVIAFETLSGPNSERADWWTEYWANAIKSGSNAQIARDFRRMKSITGDESQALDYAYYTWLQRVWGKTAVPPQPQWQSMIDESKAESRSAIESRLSRARAKKKRGIFIDTKSGQMKSGGFASGDRAGLLVNFETGTVESGKFRKL